MTPNDVILLLTCIIFGQTFALVLACMAIASLLTGRPKSTPTANVTPYLAHFPDGLPSAIDCPDCKGKQPKGGA